MLTHPPFLLIPLCTLTQAGSGSKVIYTVTGALNSAALSTVYADLGTAKGTLHVITKALIPPGVVGVSPPPDRPQEPTVYAWLANQTYYSSIFQVIGATVQGLSTFSTQPNSISATFLVPSNAAVASLAASKNTTVPQLISSLTANLTTSEMLVANLVLKKPYLLSSLKDLTSLQTSINNTIVERNVNGVVTLTTPASQAKVVGGPIYFGPSLVYIIDSVLYF